MRGFIGFLALTALVAIAPVSIMAAEGNVSRAQFTTSIVDREPIDELTSVDSGTDQVYFFSEFRNLEGTSATHRWIYNGETKFELEFKIRGSRWRVYSQKTLPAEWLGDWTVEVVAEDGTVIGTHVLKHSGS